MAIECRTSNSQIVGLRFEAGDFAAISQDIVDQRISALETGVTPYDINTVVSQWVLSEFLLLGWSTVPGIEILGLGTNIIQSTSLVYLLSMSF